MAKPRKNIWNFTLAGIDELNMFPSEAQRQAALESIGKSVKVWELVLGIVVIGGTVIAIDFGLKELVKWMLPGVDRTTRVILEIARLLFVIGSAFLVIRMLHRWGVRHELRKQLLQAGVPVCVGCGYLLRGLPPQTEACPECGKALDQPVRSILQASTDGAESTD